MSTVAVTKSVIWVALLGLIIYDVFVASNKKPDDTISEIIGGLGDKWKLVPVMMGVLLGHWFGLVNMHLVMIGYVGGAHLWPLKSGRI